MICRNYDDNKKFGLLQFDSGYVKFYLNSPKGYSRKIINAQTVQEHTSEEVTSVWFHAAMVMIVTVHIWYLPGKLTFDPF